MSDLASTFFPSTCSGNMYAAVPAIVPSSVRGGIVCVEADGSIGPANPKSRTFTRPFSLTMMFEGLMPR